MAASERHSLLQMCIWYEQVGVS